MPRLKLPYRERKRNKQSFILVQKLTQTKAIAQGSSSETNSRSAGREINHSFETQ
jgi:hypothetical protein